jgi:apolipoprotein N-acyltransferase
MQKDFQPVQHFEASLRIPSLSLPGSLLLAAIAGALCIAGYAPFYLYPITILGIAIFFHLVSQSTSRWKAAWVGLAFGLGFFGAGVSWVYISLHDFGGMPMWMAVLATAGLCFFLALFPAIGSYIGKALPVTWLALPVTWVLLEWVRGWIFTGFPWLNIGYSQVPASPLAGYAPIIGVYGVSFLLAITASLLLQLSQIKHRKTAAIGLCVIVILGIAGKYIPWTQPVGAPISVALLQGNIPQDIKWSEAEVINTLETYASLASRTNAQLIVMPETALPLLSHHIPETYIARLHAHALANQGDILMGLVEYESGQFYNSVVSIGTANPQTYRKSHLVPFGEFIPLKQVFGWVYEHWLNIPLTDLSRGESYQTPMLLSGLYAAIDICYEDVFGEEIIRQLPKANLLINVSNDAWYGESLAAYQHLQMSQMRALETGRMMLRATNTGATAVINANGAIVSHLPHFETGLLEATVTGHAGATPYIRFGNWPILLILFGSIALLWGRRKR